MITKSPQYVNQTAAGRQISAWVAIRATGPLRGDVAARISAHFSDSRVLVNVDDVEGFKSATGQNLNAAVSGLVVDGVTLYDSAVRAADEDKWLKRAAAIYRKHQIPDIPGTGPESELMAAMARREQIRKERTAEMSALIGKAGKVGLEFYNFTDEGPQSVFYIAGLARLRSFGLNLVTIIA